MKRAFELTDERFQLTPVSRTFQGRDVFAPVTAHIANGMFGAVVIEGGA